MGFTNLHLLYLLQLEMPWTHFRTAGAVEAVYAEEVETSTTTGSSKVRELRDQLAVLMDLVAQQSMVAQQQAYAPR